MTPIDFRGFRFGNVHSSDLHLEVVSTSNRYEARTLPNPTDTTQDIPGSDGQYYFGSIYKNREITVNVAFDNVTEQIYRKIRQLFATDKPQDLVFDEEPYKTWKAKLKSKPEFKSLCFIDDEKNRVYKGSGKLQFICYFPYAFGFDKYVVKAADYYMLTPPEQILCELSNDEDNFYFASRDLPAPVWIPADLRYHYNLSPKDGILKWTGAGTGVLIPRDKDYQNKGNRYWDPNDSIVWKTGFPTIDQVQNGELYFDLNDEKKTLVTTRGYWDNIPQWQSTAKLLTTPTLDYDQGLMYMPQYSKTNYINMELGFDFGRQTIGTRILVYNPGDLPIDWEITINENQRGFWSGRGSEKFRVRRFNVERLSIPNAVDWCGLKTLYDWDDEKYKYGKKYFARKGLNFENVYESLADNEIEFQSFDDSSTLSKDKINLMLRNGMLPGDKNWGITTHLVFEYEDTRVGAEEQIGFTSYTLNQTILPSEVQIKIKNQDQSLSPSDIDKAIKFYGAQGVAINGQKLTYNGSEELIDGITILGILFNSVYIDNNYEYTGPYSDANGVKDDELLRQESLTDGPIVYPESPKSSDIAFNLHLRNGEAGYRLINGLEFKYNFLEDAHPKYCYYAEPIPRQQLGKFIRLFYWQSKQLSEGEIIYDNDDLKEFQQWVNKNFYLTDNIDFKKGEVLAQRYEEVLSQCITEEEEFELYWDTLKQLFKDFLPLDGITSEELFYEYVNSPLEYVSIDSRDLDYGQEIFNAFKYPTWMTEDYIEVDSSKFNGINLINQYLEAIGIDSKSLFLGDKIYYNSSLLKGTNYQALRLKLDKILGDGGCINDLLDDYYYINSETRMLYTLEEPKANEFNYKPSKVIMNEAITKGHWFKIPPGWSMIAIEPVMDSNLYGGKRWLDARPFNWGYSGDLNHNQKEVAQLFNFIYKKAENAFTAIANNQIIEAVTFEKREYDSDLQFKKWYEDKINYFREDLTRNLFMLEYYSHKQSRAEQEFLSIINDFWEMLSPYYSWTARKGVYKDPSSDYVSENGILYIDPKFDANGYPIHCITGHISDWWWYACNYIWANFPPIYWTTADMLTNIKIKYTPLFY